MAGLIPYRNSTRAMTPNNMWNYMLSDDFFGGFLKDDFFSGQSIKTDVKDAGQEFLVEAELPGIPKEAINVDIDHGVLTISAEQSYENDQNTDGYICRERRYGKMQRSFSLENVDQDAITANYENGILKLKLPKSEKSITKRTIDVQ